MLLLCQEFDMINAIKLWDSLLSDEKRFEFLSFVCAALSVGVRDNIIEGDFACCMESLQHSAKNIPDVTVLIRDAENLRQTYIKKIS
jgi:hypothetical protein